MTTQKRNRLLFGILFTILILAGACYAYINYNNSPVVTSPTPTSTLTPTPTPIGDQSPSQLEGVMVDTALANKHPLAIMIENHPDARPQVGLTDASIVYETLAEGGITRFMGVFGSKTPTKAGPVRSARTYYVSWAREYDAFYAHVGGSGDALGRIKAVGVKDLSQFSIGTYAFWREPRGGIATEHTMFTDPKKLYKYAWSVKKWPKTCTFPLWTFKDPNIDTTLPSVNNISVNFSYGTTYQAKWKYDKTKNYYLRYMAGSAHRDRISGKQITAKNILLQYIPFAYKAGKKDHNLGLLGTNKIVLFRDGTVIKGTWQKKTKYSKTLFFDSKGQPLVFNKGNTWIEAVSPGHSQVSYKITNATTPTPSPSPSPSPSP